MGVGNTYRFNSEATDYSTCFMIGGDKVSYLADPVFPPVVTRVTPSDCAEAMVDEVRLDLSNMSDNAMIYVSCTPVAGLGGTIWGRG